MKLLIFLEDGGPAAAGRPYPAPVTRQSPALTQRVRTPGARPSSRQRNGDDSQLPENMITSILPNPTSLAPAAGTKLLLRGVHVHLNDAMRRSMEAKAERLFRHEPTILRLRIDVERGPGGGAWLFRAKGHVEIYGPDLRASVTTEDAHKSVTLLIDKLDRMLRKRATARRADRYQTIPSADLNGAN